MYNFRLNFTGISQNPFQYPKQQTDSRSKRVDKLQHSFRQAAMFPCVTVSISNKQFPTIFQIFAEKYLKLHVTSVDLIIRTVKDMMKSTFVIPEF